MTDNRNQGCNSKLDDSPSENQVMYTRRRSEIRKVEECEEELEYDDLSTDLIIERRTDRKETDQQESVTAFCTIKKCKELTARGFTLKHSEEEIEWDTQAGGEYLE